MGFRTKLTLANSLIVFAFAAFFALYLPSQQEESTKQALEARANTLASIFAAVSQPALALGDELGDPEAVAADLANWSKADPELSYVVLLKPDGSVFARYRQEGVALEYERHEVPTTRSVSYGPGHLHVAIPLEHEDTNIGALSVGFSTASIAAARTASQTSSLYMSAAVFLVGLGLAYVVGRSIATPLLRSAQNVTEVSRDIVAATMGQEASSAEEAAAVAETRQSMGLLLDSAQQIADRSSEVLGNAERNAVGSKAIADRIGELNEQRERITEILATIMQVADKADLLALNASLEGTKAGEAGKGFILVAAEMRRLAENVMESVTGIRSLMKEMRDASEAAVRASGDGTQSSAATAESARQIALLTQEQRQATEQVIASMSEMAEILNHNVAAIQRSSHSASKLVTVADTLTAMVTSRAHGTSQKETASLTN